MAFKNDRQRKAVMANMKGRWVLFKRLHTTEKEDDFARLGKKLNLDIKTLEDEGDVAMRGIAMVHYYDEKHLNKLKKKIKNNINKFNKKYRADFDITI